MSLPLERHGQCLCGAVSWIVASTALAVSACHCRTCRPLERWPAAGSGLCSTTGDRRWRCPGRPCLVRLGERGFCRHCGTHLFYRLKSSRITPFRWACSRAATGCWTARSYRRKAAWLLLRQPDPPADRREAIASTANRTSRLPAPAMTTVASLRATSGSCARSLSRQGSCQSPAPAAPLIRCARSPAAWAHTPIKPPANAPMPG